MTNLYIVATPIGNLEDITLRAIRILKEVDIIFAEDTRVTKKLLNKYEIKNQIDSYHAQSNDSKTKKIIELLKEGKDIALVSDAGTPTISDPGSKLISEVRSEVSEVNVVCIPGPSALASALSISGLPVDQFTFLGFLPHKKGRETLFKEIAESERTIVFYESTHRILKALESLDKFCSEKQIGLAKELTKIHEEMILGTASEILEYLNNNPDKVKGEFVVIVSK